MKEERGGNPELMALIGKTHLTWKRYVQRALVGKGISLKQYYLLLQLSACEFLLPSQVAAMLFCDRPTASLILKNMEKAGWVVRTKDAGNARQVQVRIRPAGRKKMETIRRDPNLVRRFGSNPVKSLSVEEQKQAKNLLEKLYAQTCQVAERDSD